jgi:hypothetical protein
MNVYKLIEILEAISECLWDVEAGEAADHLPADRFKLNELIEDLRKEL